MDAWETPARDTEIWESILRPRGTCSPQQWFWAYLPSSSTRVASAPSPSRHWTPVTPHAFRRRKLRRSSHPKRSPQLRSSRQKQRRTLRSATTERATAAAQVTSPSPSPAAPTPTATAESGGGSIPGLSAVDVTGNLKNSGLQCAGPTSTAVRDVVVWTCKGGSANGDLAYEVLITGRGPTRIESVNGTVFQFGAAASDTVATQFLGYLATTPYSGAQPAGAKAWVEANARGVSTSFGGVKFELTRASTGRAHFLVLSSR